MTIKRILALVAVLSLQFPTIVLADFFAPDEEFEAVEAEVSEEAEAARSPAVPEYSPYHETLFTTGPGVDQMLGSKRGYIHPFLTLGGYHTDNLFNSRRDKESDWITVVSPGIWFALPASRQRLVDITTLNSAPGGLEVSRFKTRGHRKFQAYALYRADINELADNDEQNHVNQRAEALLEYNMPGGLSLELLDIYEIDHDDYNSGDSGPTSLDKFHSNLLSPSITYQVGPRLAFRAEYQLYTLDYNSSENEDNNRDDKVYSVYGFYKLTPRLTSFLQYEHVSADYDDNTRSDFTEDNYYGGIQWRATAKSKGRIKLGYGEKDSDDGTDGDNNEFLVEARVDHRFTPKTAVHLRVVRKTYATDLSGTRDVLSQRVYLGYSQQFRPKWLARARLEYVRNEYDGEITVGTKTDEREDEYYGFRAEIGFAMQRWLNLSLGYSMKKRDSNFDENDYTSNTVFFYLTAAL